MKCRRTVGEHGGMPRNSLNPLEVLLRLQQTGSLAQAEGLREGDLIKEVNRAESLTVEDFTAAISRMRRGDAVLLRVLREARAFYVVLKPAD